MKNQGILYCGSAIEACNELDNTEPTNFELRAALMNALKRIDTLEKQVVQMSEPKQFGVTQ